MLRRIFVRFTKMEIALLAVVFLLGLIFTFGVPVGLKPDEHTHYWRSLQIASGDFFCRDQYVVNDSYYNIVSKIERGVGGDKKGKVALSYYRETVANYHEEIITEDCSYHQTQAGYFLSAGAIKLSMFIPSGWKVIIGFYAARLVNFTIFFLCLVIALNLLPRNLRLTVYLIALLPTTTYQASAIGYDSLFLGLVLLTFSYFLNLWRIKKSLKLTNFIILCVLIISCNLVKGGYYMLLLLPLFIPFPKYLSKKKLIVSYLIYFVISVFSVLLIAGRISIVSPVRPNTNDAKVSSARSMNYNFAIDNPVHFTSLFFSTISEDTIWYYRQAVGTLGWLDYSFGDIIYIISVIIITLVLCWQLKKTPKNDYLSLTKSIVLTILTLGNICFIIILFYFTWSPFGAGKIVGAQGRYFLPLVPFLIYGLYGIIKNIGLKKVAKITTIICSALLIIYCSWSVFHRFWDFKDSLPGNGDELKLLLENTNTSSLRIVASNTFVLDLLPERKLMAVDFYYEKTDDIIPIYTYALKDKNCDKVLESDFIPSEVFIESSGSARINLKNIYKTGDLGGEVCFEIKETKYVPASSGELKFYELNGEPLVIPLYVSG